MVDLNNAVYELHQKGYSYNQIAQELNISKSKAYRIINNSEAVSENETKDEPTVNKTFQSIGKKEESVDRNKSNNSVNLKLQVKLRKMELEHESEMRRLEFEEKERIREYEAEQNSFKNENLVLKTQLENLGEEIERMKLKNEALKKAQVIASIDETTDYEEIYKDEDDSEEEYVPELDILIKEDIKELLTHIIETDKYYDEDLQVLIDKISKIKEELAEQSEIEEVEVSYFEEYNLLKKVEKVIKHFIENFDEHTTFFSSTINLIFNEELFSQMEEYSSNISE